MKSIVDYRIVEIRYDNTQRLSGEAAGKEVTEAINDGWEPLGGICNLPNTGLILQAMVKYSK